MCTSASASSPPCSINSKWISANSPDVLTPTTAARVAKLFGDLSEILPTVIGPNPNGSFQQHIRIIDETRARLIEGSPNLSAEPTEDTGLRAAYNALSSLQRDQFYDHPEIEKTVADLRVKLDSLDVVRGPLHRSTVKESLELIGKGARQMSEVLSARLANRT